MPIEVGWWRPLSARRALAVLIGLVAISTAIRIGFAREVRSPFVFMDELGYEQMAKSLVRSGNLTLFGEAGAAYNPLYSVVLAPVYALTKSAPQAYLWAKAVNAVVMSLAIFPVYGIARFVLSRTRSLGVAALSLIAPLMFYTDLEMSENLAYPLALVAISAMLHAVRHPRPRNDALLLGAIVLASAARLQNIALLPAALTAILLIALVKPEPRATGRLPAVTRAVAAHRLLFGTTVVALAAALARTIANGGALPLAGRYANVGKAHASPLRVLEIAGQHLAALDFALGVIPFAGALLAAYALVRLGFPSRALIFGSVASSVTTWLVVEVAFDAAAFDGGTGQGIPRIHERYLIYVVPLFLVALVAALGAAARPKVGSRAHVAIAVVAALAPAAIPFSRVINYSIVADSFGLQIFGTDVGGRIAPISQPLLVAVAVGVVLGIAYLYALLRPHPSFAIVMTVIAFLIMSTLVRDRINGASKEMALVDPLAHVSWVDRAVDGDVVLIGGGGARRSAILDTAFDNFAITRLYYVCKATFGSGFGERSLTVDNTGRLLDETRPLMARFAVLPADLGAKGRVLARDAKGGLVLVAPSGGVLTIPSANPPAAHCSG